MSWFNPIGLAWVLLLLLPNALYAARHPELFENAWHCRIVEIGEQIGRIGCFILMVFRVPRVVFGFFFPKGALVYVAIGSALVAAYAIGWLFAAKHPLFRAYYLSIVPSVLFLFCGGMTRDLALSAAAVLFSVCHITISLKNAYAEKERESAV